MDCQQFEYSGHAVRRMFERGIYPHTVNAIVAAGDVIADYPADQPFPSQLLLGFDRLGAVHVVAAKDAVTGVCYIVTAYRPDPRLWRDDFRVRRFE